MINDRGVHTESVCSVPWEISLRKASVGPESTLPGRKGSFAQLYVLARISAHPSLFSPLIVKFLTVQYVVGVHFLLLIKILE